MGHPPSGHRKYQISHTWEIHNEIIRLTAVGMRQVDIAAQLGVTAAMVSYTLNSDIARARLAELRGMRDAEAVDVGKQIKEAEVKCLQTLKDLRDGIDTPAAIRAKICFGILDRGDHPPTQRIQGTMMHGIFSLQDIEEIKRRALENGKSNGTIVDVDVEAEKEEEPANASG